MNKQILALSVIAALASGAASATVTVYEKDGYKFSVKGDVEVNYKKAPGKMNEAKINIDDADFAFLAESMINDETKLFGEAAFDGDATLGDTDDVEVGEEKGVELDNLYIGLARGPFTVKAGRVANLLDGSGVSTDQEIGGMYKAWDSAGLKDKTDQVIVTTFSGDVFFGGVDLTQDKDGYDLEAKDKQQFTAQLGAKLGKATFTGYYATESVGDIDALHIDATFQATEAILLGANYGKASAGDTDYDSMGASAKLTAGSWTYSAGYSILDTDGEDTNKWYANTSYQLTSYSEVFAEIADEEAADELGYAAGVRIKF